MAATGIVVDPRLVETVSAPTNIAVVKYWGKADASLNTPINSSVSLTLDQDVLRAVTTVAASKDFPYDSLWLNNKEEDVSTSKRFQSCLSLVRGLAQDRIDPQTGKVLVKKEDWPQYRIRVISMNTFPTAAGLASSAAGYAALVYGLAQLFCAKEEYPGQLSAIARQGSGSACRSLYGGLVKWEKGEKEDGSDSIAVQIADERHWPELRALVVVASGAEKETPSTAGMINSVRTSDLLRYRAQSVVPPRVTQLTSAFLSRDFATFGELTMRDSNQFHATCLDTMPPIFYMNATSRGVIRLVHEYNEACGAVCAAYTFDAGPNAVIFTTEEHVAPLLGSILRHYPLPEGQSGLVGGDEGLFDRATQNSAQQQQQQQGCGAGRLEGAIEKVYAVKIGGGARRVAQAGGAGGLMDLATGLPLGWGPDN